MKKNYYLGIDLARAASLILVLLYHLWVLNGQVTSSHIPFVDKWIMLGGEIGVTGFFCISGFGIYWALKNNNQGYLAYIKKRLKKIVPQYYAVILVLILIGDCAVFLSKENILMVFSYFTFLQNIKPGWAGAINGALWTMATIVQFYIVAPFIYKAIRKFGILVPFFSVIFTICVKFILFNSPVHELDILWGSRQLLCSSIDNFVIGMYVSYFLDKKQRETKKKYINYLGLFIGISLVTFVLYLGTTYGIHTVNSSGYIWHSLLAICIGIILFYVSNMKINEGNIIVKLWLWLSKYEYGIYLWHIVIIRNIINNSALYQQIVSLQHGMWLGYVVLLSICILFGFATTKMMKSL